MKALRVTEIVIVVVVIAMWAAMLTSVPPVVAQTIIPQPAQFLTVVQTVPGAVPTSLTCLVGFDSSCLYKLTHNPTATDPYVCGGDIEAAGQTILLQDANAVTLLNNTLGSSGSQMTWFFPTPLTNSDTGCRMFPGGVYIQAGSTGATFRLTIKFNK